jgi:hypothetical protein
MVVWLTWFGALLASLTLFLLPSLK